MNEQQYHQGLLEHHQAIERGRLDIALRWGITLCTSIEACARDIAGAEAMGVITPGERTRIMSIAAVLHEATECLKKSFPADSLEQVA
jgi:hypothetical protein